MFRGCAEAKYQHDYGCDREQQAVEVIDQRGAAQQVENRFRSSLDYSKV